MRELGYALVGESLDRVIKHKISDAYLERVFNTPSGIRWARRRICQQDVVVDLPLHCFCRSVLSPRCGALIVHCVTANPDFLFPSLVHHVELPSVPLMSKACIYQCVPLIRVKIKLLTVIMHALYQSVTEAKQLWVGAIVRC